MGRPVITLSSEGAEENAEIKALSASHEFRRACHYSPSIQLHMRTSVSDKGVRYHSFVEASFADFQKLAADDDMLSPEVKTVFAEAARLVEEHSSLGFWQRAARPGSITLDVPAPGLQKVTLYIGF